MLKKILPLVSVMAIVAGCESEVMVINSCQNCDTDEICCDNICVKKDSPSHCGTCDTVCKPNESCVDYKCVQDACSSCKNGEKCCDDTCKPLNTSENCGECGIQCKGDTPLCSDGQCTSSCKTDELQCGSSCVNPDSDNDNCGDCGIQCTGLAFCQNGFCECHPKTCEELGKNCGTVDNGCGAKIECGSCADGVLCTSSAGRPSASPIIFICVTVKSAQGEKSPAASPYFVE